jgi:HEPN domain-containing protein
METTNHMEHLAALRDSHDIGSIIRLLETQFQFWLKHSGEQPLDNIRQMSMVYTAIGSFVKAGYDREDHPELTTSKNTGFSVVREQLVSLLLEFIQPTFTYCINHPPVKGNEADYHTHLILVLPNDRSGKQKDLEPLIELVRLGDQKLTCTVIQLCYLEQLTTEGHLFYSFYCRSRFLLSEDARSSQPEIDQAKYLLNKQLCKTRFAKGLRNAKDFLYCSSQLRDAQSGERNGLALYMLHQAAELSYRAVLLGLYGLNIRNHSIRTLQKHIQPVAPIMAYYCFPCSNEEERLLINLLEDAYLFARYRDDFEVTNKQLASITLMVEAVVEVADELYGKHFLDDSIANHTVNPGLALHSFYHA